MEERGDDVAAADGQHLLVGANRVAVLFSKHLRQRHGEGKTETKKKKEEKFVKCDI